MGMGTFRHVWMLTHHSRCQVQDVGTSLLARSSAQQPCKGVPHLHSPVCATSGLALLKVSMIT